MIMISCLRHRKFAVRAILGHELFVSARLDYASTLQYHYLVSTLCVVYVCVYVCVCVCVCVCVTCQHGI